MSRWWRAYDDALHDPKVQGLPPPLFKFWFNLLCIASKHDGLIPPLASTKTELRLRLDICLAHLNDLIKRGLIEEVEGGYEPHNWMKRQYKSDSSTSRVKRFRESKRNVSETPPDNRVQNTDTEKKEDAALSRASPDDGGEASLFARGRQILGPKAGGMVVKLLRAREGKVPLARSALELAATKGNPREYIGRIIAGEATGPPERGIIDARATGII